jgi:hypothetical protein
MTLITPKTRQRIERAVLRVERLPVGLWRTPPANRDLGAGHPRLLIAAEDIEHGAQGTAVIATGDVGNLSASTVAVEVLNLRDKVWAGSLLMASWPMFDGDGSSSDMLWHVEQAWSATLIRGTAPSGGILAGNTGTVSSVVPLNGHYGLTTASVTVPSNFPNVAANARIMAALAYDITGSRWEALPLGTSSTTPSGDLLINLFHTPDYYFVTGPDAGTKITSQGGIFMSSSTNYAVQDINWKNQLGPDIGIAILPNVGGHNLTFTVAGTYQFTWTGTIRKHWYNLVTPPDPIEWFDFEMRLDDNPSAENLSTPDTLIYEHWNTSTDYGSNAIVDPVGVNREATVFATYTFSNIRRIYQPTTYRTRCSIFNTGTPLQDYGVQFGHSMLTVQRLFT